MHGRRIYHARGKVLGGSSQHQRPDLPARQPARLRALGGRPGHGDLGLRPLPAVLQADGDVPSRPPPTTRGAATTARSSSSAVRRRTRCSARSSTRVQEAGYPLTDDVNGYRQEGFAPFDRNIHRGRRLSRGAGLPAPDHGRRANLEVRTGTFVTADPVRGDAGGRRRGGDRAAGTERILAGEVILAGGAINSPQLLLLSGVGAGRRPGRARDPRRRRPARRRASTSRTTSRCTSSIAACSPCRCSRPRPQLWRPPVHRRAVAVPAQRSGRHEPLRGRRIRRARTTTSPTRT